MAIELTQEIGRRITTIAEDTRETTFLFQRLSIKLLFQGKCGRLPEHHASPNEAPLKHLIHFY